MNKTWHALISRSKVAAGTCKGRGDSSAVRLCWPLAAHCSPRPDRSESANIVALAIRFYFRAADATATRSPTSTSPVAVVVVAVVVVVVMSGIQRCQIASIVEWTVRFRLLMVINVLIFKKIFSFLFLFFFWGWETTIWIERWDDVARFLVSRNELIDSSFPNYFYRKKWLTCHPYLLSTWPWVKN